MSNPGFRCPPSLDQNSLSTEFTDRNKKFVGGVTFIFEIVSEVIKPFKSSFARLKVGCGGSGGGGGVRGLSKLCALSFFVTHGFCTTLDSNEIKNFR